jgi:EAL domain-containing protein (putative c-di-GMP-specific phosphodiesterase class I)
VGATESAFGKLIIDFAHTLGLRTVAEGVEHVEQVAILQRLGCHFAQGYLFAEPLPATELATVLDGARAASTWREYTVRPTT